MKKIILACLILSGCAAATDAGNGLTQLKTEPKNCDFLYTIDSSAATYDMEDALDYLEKSIVERDGFGDSYYIEKTNVVDNAGAVFGPRQTFKIKAKVYNCKK